MKKIIVAIAMVSLFMVPVLPAQGKTISKGLPDTEAGKIHVWGNVSCVEDMTTNKHCLFALLRLDRSGTPITGARIQLQDTKLADRGDGSYRGYLWDVRFRRGDVLQLSVEFPRTPAFGFADPRYIGRIKMAELRIGNTIEWIFPIHEQRIDLSAYPAGVPLRWDFTGTPAQAEIFIKILGRPVVYRADVPGEEITIPIGTLQPRHLYIFQLNDENHQFKVSSSFTSSSTIRFGLTSMINVTTQAAK